MRNFLTLLTSAVSEVALMCSPILICLTIFAFFGDNLKNFIAIPEWSFLSIFLFVEILKDHQSKPAKTQNEVLLKKSGICFYSILIIFSSTFMALTFAASRGYLENSALKIEEFSFLQPIVTGVAALLSVYVKIMVGKSKAGASATV